MLTSPTAMLRQRWLHSQRMPMVCWYRMRPSTDETVHDFQLAPGDQLNLRLQSAKDNQYHVVPFRFIDSAGDRHARIKSQAASGTKGIIHSIYCRKMTELKSAKIDMISNTLRYIPILRRMAHI